MDAQNAVENASTKPTTASPKQTGLEPSQQQQQQPKSALSRKSPTAVRSSPPVKEAKSHIKDDDGGADANSEAETIVLPDKNGQHSPAKTRKVIKHEAKSDAEDGAAADPPSRKLSSAGKSTIGKGKDAREAKDARDGRDGRDAHEGGEKSQKPPSSASGRDGTVAGSLNTAAAAAAAAAAVAKKKRLHTVASQDKQRTKAECSSGLSSAPASPPPQGQAASHNHREQQPLARRRRLSNAARSAASDSDSIRAQSPKPPSVAKETSRSIEKLVPHKRKAPKAESEDDADSHKARRQRTSNVGSGDSTKASRDHHGSNHGAANKSSSAKSHQDPHGHGGPHPVKSASPPPPPRSHRRSISTQLPSQSANGLSHKKKRVPAPLQSTGYHSDESSGGGGSPRIRSSKLRSLVTPATTESNISPAKMAPHKKHLDAHGQTFLARACARGEYEIAKQRLGERPEDLNVADFAGNTPLQIASINGYEEIVKLLLEAGCALDCVNYDKDTPLLDAVENGHVNVVKLLLDAGVNPRKANLNGEEPLDLITKDTDNGDEIRQLLVDAKQRMGERRRTSEEHAPKQQDGRDSHGPESPRRSPAATTSNNAAASGRRSGTVRATKTSNHLLYMPMDDKTLRQAAGRGDEETVTRILQVRESFDDPESMVAAARGGHDMIINLLLALGGASPDPAPVASMSAELATPMLAAIGQENIKVVELLLSQAKFDPTRKFKGETYYEIARRRQGTNWKEEEHILKDAYDAHKRSQKDSVKNKSPPAREPERDAKRGARSEPKDKPEARDSRDESSKSHKRKASSPSRELNMKKPEKGEKSEKGGSSAGGASKNGPASPKETREKRRSNSFTANPDEQIPPKRGPGRPRKEDRLPTIAIPDRESPPLKKQSAKAKRTESDLNAMSSEGETVKPRRKLISGKDLKGEREKQRRASMVSTTSSMKEPPSPRDTRDEPSEKSKSEKFRDRTKQLKRDESRDRRSVSGEVSGKRHRSSATPPRASSEKEGNEAPVKRRRLDVDGKEKRLKTNPSAEDRSQKPVASRDGPAKIRKDKAKDGDKDKDKPLDDEDRKEPPAKSRKTEPAPGHGRRESAKSVSTEKSIHVKSEDPDVEMRDVDRPDEEVDARALKAQKEEEKKKKAEAAVLEAKRKEEEKRRAEEERRKADEELEKKRRQEEDMRRREEEAQRKLKEEEERQRKEKEEERKRKEEEEEQRRLKEEEARKRREEEERQRVEQEEKRRKAEEEARRIREEEERKRQQEEERKRQEEEDRLRKEQLEREAAEQARRKKEEEERKEQERLRELERQREVERRRAAREAEQRRLFEEQEAARLAKLPPLLQWLDGSPQPKTNQFAQKLSTMQGVRYDCIRPEATGSPEGREQWVLNTQVALLLGEKDLQLSRYTAWERIPVSRIAKIMIWRLEADRYSLTSPNLYDIGSQLPSYYCGEDPERLSYKTIEKLRSEAREKFLEMDMFFVKASDLMFIVPTIPHLRDLKLTLAYRELPEDESLKWQSAQKWKIDPDANRFFGFAPGNKHYINGELVHEQRPGLSAVSKTPFPERRVPRRGLATVSPDDPEYVRLCKEQGLDHLLDASTCTSTSSPSPLLPNGVSSSPTAAAAGRPDHFPSHGASGDFLGDRSPRTTAPPLVNGNGNGNGNGIIYPSSTITGSIANNVAAEVKQNPPPLVNGINGSTTTNGSDS